MNDLTTKHTNHTKNEIPFVYLCISWFDFFGEDFGWPFGIEC